MPHSRHPFKRSERVGDLLRQVISEALMDQVRGGDLEGLTITGVRMTDDLQMARVLYRLWNPEARQKVAKKLSWQARKLQKLVGREMKLRYAPYIKFEYDDSPDYGDKIDHLLKSVHREEE